MTTETSNSSNSNGLAKFSLIIGIVGILCSFLMILGFLPVWFGAGFSTTLVVGLGLVAVITGVIAQRQIKTNGQNNKKTASWAIILGIIGLVLYIFYILVLAPAIANTFQDINEALNG